MHEASLNVLVVTVGHNEHFGYYCIELQPDAKANAFRSPVVAGQLGEWWVPRPPAPSANVRTQGAITRTDCQFPV